MLRRLITDTAYHIHTSPRYASIKRFFFNFLENPNSKNKNIFDSFMIMLILISVFILVKDVKSEVNSSLLFFNNVVISTIFLIEYLLRLWISSSVCKIIIEQNEHDTMLSREFQLYDAFKKIVKAKLKYILSFKAIIDLLAVLPFFHQLRFLRIFILFRVFKLFRYVKSIQIFVSVLKSKQFEFITLLVSASIVVFVSSVLIYVVEANHPNTSINTFFEAFYWSIVTISTVGYGDISPVTEFGRVVAIFVIVAGITVFSFTTSLIVTAFTQKLDEIKDIKIENDITKIKDFYLVCGYEEIAKDVIKKLTKHSKVIVLDEDENRVNRAKLDGFSAFNYDPGSVESYKKLHIDVAKQVKAVLCLRESDIENVYTALTIRSFNKEIFILSLLMNEINRNKLTFAGVNELLYAKELVGMIAKELVGQRVAFEAIHELRTNLHGIKMQEIVINKRILENFKSIGEFDNKKFRLILLGIYQQSKKEFLFNPNDTIPIAEGDYLLVIGNIVFIKEFDKYLHTDILDLI
ncbi:MAG: ion transporter [Campylobacterota bacterium]|nr:ion transporter [Campylobacterota bacterium]